MKRQIKKSWKTRIAELALPILWAILPGCKGYVEVGISSNDPYGSKYVEYNPSRGGEVVVGIKEGETGLGLEAGLNVSSSHAYTNGTYIDNKDFMYDVRASYTKKLKSLSVKPYVAGGNMWTVSEINIPNSGIRETQQSNTSYAGIGCDIGVKITNKGEIYAGAEHDWLGIGEDSENVNGIWRYKLGWRQTF
ncbi:MAG: hypothetical protein QXO70_00380 [Candidatus Pacearchaeota archaeon]